MATFVGVANLVPATIAAGNADTRLGRLRVDPSRRDGPALVVIRPEHLDLKPEGSAGGGLAGRVVARRFSGSELLFEVAVDSQPGRLWVEAGPLVDGIAIGDTVRLVLRVSGSVAFSGPGSATDPPDVRGAEWRGG